MPNPLIMQAFEILTIDCQNNAFIQCGVCQNSIIRISLITFARFKNRQYIVT